MQDFDPDEVIPPGSPTDPSASAGVDKSSQRRLALLGVLLLVSCASVGAGVGLWLSQLGAGLVAGGALLGGWSWMFFGEITEQPAPVKPTKPVKPT